MRTIPLFLLVVVCVSGGLAESSLGETIRNALGKIRTTLNKHRLLAIREKFHALGDKIAAKLELTPENEVLLAETLKKLKPIKKGHVNKMGDTIQEINERSNIAELLYQGDIVLSDEQAEELLEEEDGRNKRQAMNPNYHGKQLWTDGLTYSFHNISEKVKSVFRKGAMEWQSQTCINFKEGNGKERVAVIDEDGCWSLLGNRHKLQHLSLGEGCESVGTAAHELGHALGMFHTHARHDRDKFILFNKKNVQPSWLDQFDLESEKTNDNFGITYDYGSIMHYGARSASIDESSYTMVPKDEKYIETLGSPFISFYELLMMNKLYKCLDKCKSNPCKMNGFPNPRDCSTCICPSGYGGKLCDERPSGCGKTLQATSSYQTLTDVVGKTPDEVEDFEKCHYWIEAPRGKRIEMKIKSFTNRGHYVVAVDGCSYAGVEINTQKDQLSTGYRFCAKEDAGRILVSDSNLVPVITYSRLGKTTTVLQYRIV